MNSAISSTLASHLLAGLPEEQPADDDVLEAGDLRVHPDAEVENRCDPATYGRRAAGRLVDARQQPQQRRLACAVVADQADPVAHLQRQRDVAQRLDDDDVLGSLRPIAPPALPRNAFFSERVFASKMGNSTQASRVSMKGSADNGRLCYRYCPVPMTGPSGHAGLTHAGRQRTLAAHLLQLSPCGHLLGEQRGLDAVEQTFQPADQLRLGDAQFGVRGHLVLGERQRQPLELVAQFGGQAVFELADRGGMDLTQPAAARVVQRCGPDLLEQLLDHGADPHHLGRLLDQVGDRALVVVVLRRHGVGAADDLDVVVVGVGSHGLSIPSGPSFIGCPPAQPRATRRCGPRRCRRSSPTTRTCLVTLDRPA